MDDASTGRAAHILGRRRFLAIAAGAAAVAVPRRVHAQRPTRGGVLKHIGLEPQTFDIHATASYPTHLVSSFVRRTLFKFVNGARYGPADFTIVPDLALKATWRRDGAFTAQLCERAVDVLFKTGGGGALFDDHPLQRAFRDVHAATAHISMMWEPQATTFGRVALGLPSDNPTL